MTRRDYLCSTATGAAAWMLAAADGRGVAAPEARARAGTHEVKPLPFDPKKLDGISEKMIVSHHDNNYAGAVKNLNKVEEQITAVPSDAPTFVLGGLKQSELVFTNSMILHEHYFENLGGDGKPSKEAEAAIAAAYGGFEKWEAEFRNLGLSLGGGSGWVCLSLNLHTRALRTHWSGHHTQALAFGVPLLVMDMYEHAYQMDYGAAAAQYVDAFFRNIAWEAVTHRLARAQKMLAG